jgi:hypothetical protein
MDLQNFYYLSVSVSIIALAAMSLFLFGMIIFTIYKIIGVIKKIDIFINKTEDNIFGFLEKLRKFI